MLRFLFAALLLFHGLIHLMGFAKAFKFAEMSQLTLPISRAAGVFWLLTTALFFGTAVLFLLKNDIWWMVAIPAVILSQGLILMSWQDAKFGTLANILVVTGILLAWGGWRFADMVNRELQTFLPKKTQAQEVVLTANDLVALPPTVQRWLDHANCLGKPVPPAFQLQQQGAMRTSPDGKWMPFEATQTTRIGQPGFIWMVQVEAAPFVQLVGRDKYLDGKGYMLIKLLSLVPIADARGPETDQGALLRYLGELVWCPAAVVSDYIHWEAIDERSAKATMRYQGVEASGTFTFTPEGDPLCFEAMRYYDRKGGATLEKWQVDVDQKSFREFEDVRIPTRSTVLWLLESGRFDWLKLEIQSLTYQDAN
ncbi:MAG: hypothetical protein H6574_12405 [Lewinellaceae bacterium]|nr:hypothetical protein [Saprospiraceae bacterium]MCB9316978.1 hypothetical protein [Lewinellaceae bacterium]MCB9331875.1 hypothetical protein [Lewinellaceae bacterium]